MMTPAEVGSFVIKFHFTYLTNSSNELVRKNVDVNKHERLSNITLRHTLKKGTVLLLLFYISDNLSIVYKQSVSSFQTICQYF